MAVLLSFIGHYVFSSFVGVYGNFLLSILVLFSVRIMWSVQCDMHRCVFISDR